MPKQAEKSNLKSLLFLAPHPKHILSYFTHACFLVSLPGRPVARFSRSPTAPIPFFLPRTFLSLPFCENLNCSMCTRGRRSFFVFQINTLRSFPPIFHHSSRNTYLARELTNVFLYECIFYHFLSAKMATAFHHFFGFFLCHVYVWFQNEVWLCWSSKPNHLKSWYNYHIQKAKLAMECDMLWNCFLLLFSWHCSYLLVVIWGLHRG